MKIFKTIAIAAIILATSIGARAASIENTAAKKHNAASLEAIGFGKTVERTLIEDYLAGQPEETRAIRVIVYNAAGEIVFEGDAEKPGAKEHVRKANFLMEYDNALYYWIEQ